MSSISESWGTNDALNEIAKAIKNHDSTPTPTKNQWVREAAVRLACAAIQRTTETRTVLNSADYASMSIEIAQEIWDRTVPK